MDTSPRDAEGAVSLPLPRDTPSLEMFSNGVDMLSLIENKGVLRLVAWLWQLLILYKMPINFERY